MGVSVHKWPGSSISEWLGRHGVASLNKKTGTRPVLERDPYMVRNA